MLTNIASKSVSRGPASLFRRFSHDARWNSSSGNTMQFQRAARPAAVVAPATRVFTRSITSMTFKAGSNEDFYKGNLSSRLQLHLQRTFSSNADLPPYAEIGLPLLTVTMKEGNIVKWVVKVGDLVYPGDVICEVETDRSTVELESPEDGYIAKIFKGDGSKGVKIGEAIAVVTEEKEDVPKFKDYTPSEPKTGALETEDLSVKEA